MDGFDTMALALHSRVAKVEQRQEDHERAVDEEFDRIRFWVKVYLSITTSLVGSGALAAIGWAWHLGLLWK